ncbi:transmembrane amino acid transporter [Paraphaeosphaeria minitans]|uniref:Transmembrane amino acid transporter n=1 Tax=Paraphaeosphaeria minitans TaxID=565426 RepID=A0A9P6GQ99_9PLEO|nr:transmembrane amino acid transporter [Paraphaeosphaeria minitans]
MSESQKLLYGHHDDSDSDPDPGHDTQLIPARRRPSPASASRSRSRQSSASPAPGTHPNGRFGAPQRQSSFAQPRPDGAPRTPNRVRFEEPRPSMNGDAQGGDWVELEEDDYLEAGEQGRQRTQRLPLLTGIEAPSVTVATEAFNPEDHLESARPRSNMRSAFMNMANSIIGAGIIGQPYAFHNAGLVTGTLLLIGLTMTVDWTIQLIVINSKLSGTDSFQATVEHCFGKSGLVAISLAQWIFAFGGMMAFCVIVGDTIPKVLDALFPSLSDTSFLWLLTNRRAIIILLVLGISYPLSLYRDIAKAGSPQLSLPFHTNSLQLAKASGLAMISMAIIIVTVITQSFRVPPESRGKIEGSVVIRPGIFEAVGVISFAFVCHHNSLLIYGSLRTPTIDRFARVTHYSTGISLVACLVMAYFGYLTFGDKTQGNVLNNFPNDNVFVNIARFCFGLNMLTTLPLEAFVCREVMNNYWFSDEPYQPNRHIIFTTSLVVAAMMLSLLTCDLGVIFELFGATSACALAYILPPLCYIKLSKERTSQTYLAMAVIGFGCTVMAISLVKTTGKMSSGTESQAKCS